MASVDGLFDQARSLHQAIEEWITYSRTMAERDQANRRFRDLAGAAERVERAVEDLRRARADGLSPALPERPPPLPDSLEDPATYLSSNDVVLLIDSLEKTYVRSLDEGIAQAYVAALDALDARPLSDREWDFCQEYVEDDGVHEALTALGEASDAWRNLRKQRELPDLSRARALAESIRASRAALDEALEKLGVGSSSALMELEDKLSAGHGVPLVDLSDEDLDLLRHSHLATKVWLRKR